MRILLAVTILGLISAGSSADEPVDIAKRIGQYVSVDLTTDISQLSEKQRKMIPLLIEAAKIMNECFWYEAYGDRKATDSDSISDPQLRRFAEINYGPWDRLNGNTVPSSKVLGPSRLARTFIHPT